MIISSLLGVAAFAGIAHCKSSFHYVSRSNHYGRSFWTLDVFVVMPNNVHAIVSITDAMQDTPIVGRRVLRPCRPDLLCG